MKKYVIKTNLNYGDEYLSGKYVHQGQYYPVVTNDLSKALKYASKEQAVKTSKNFCPEAIDGIEEINI